MRTMNLRDANQQFSKLAREIEETGETILVLRNGKPALKITPAEPKVAERTPAQKAALARLLDPKNHVAFPPVWKFDREEIWDEITDRLSAARGRPNVGDVKPHAKAEPKPGAKKTKAARQPG